MTASRPVHPAPRQIKGPLRPPHQLQQDKDPTHRKAPQGPYKDQTEKSWSQTHMCSSFLKSLELNDIIFWKTRK